MTTANRHRPLYPMRRTLADRNAICIAVRRMCAFASRRRPHLSVVSYVVEEVLTLNPEIRANTWLTTPGTAQNANKPLCALAGRDVEDAKWTYPTHRNLEDYIFRLPRGKTPGGLTRLSALGIRSRTNVSFWFSERVRDGTCSRAHS